jgi:hypothetical protein
VSGPSEGQNDPDISMVKIKLRPPQSAASSRTFRFRNTNFISHAIFLTDEMCRLRAADILDASAPRFANLANRCFSASVQCFGRAACFTGFIRAPLSWRPLSFAGFLMSAASRSKRFKALRYRIRSSIVASSSIPRRSNYQAEKKPAGATPSASPCDCRLTNPVPSRCRQPASERLTKG